MKNILLFAGTTEGRLLAEFLIHQPVRLHTAVATAYGASLLPSAPSMTVSSHRMNEAQMIDFIQQQHFDLVLDATHPYASEASANISGACTRTQVPYLRILRDCQTSADTSSNPIHPSEIFVDTTAEAVDCLNHQEGPVFLTTGSKTLPDFMKINNASERVFVRILPNAEMLTACMSLGLPASHIFCMQGPFDVGMNTATIQHICRLWEKDHPDSNLSETPLYMVTKQSGRTGGFDEKLEAAAQAQVCLLYTSFQSARGIGIFEYMANAIIKDCMSHPPYKEQGSSKQPQPPYQLSLSMPDSILPDTAYKPGSMHHTAACPLQRR